jgi:hypothetical protein
MVRWLQASYTGESIDEAAMAQLLEQAAQDASDPRAAIELYWEARRAGVASAAQSESMVGVLVNHPKMQGAAVLEAAMAPTLTRAWSPES